MNILEEAIAEAKTLREAAIVNAYKQLEENVTPAIKEAIAQKLQEEEEIEDMDMEAEEETLDETKNSGFKEVKPKKPVKEEQEDEEPEEGSDEEPEDKPEEEETETEETEETETTEEEPVDDEEAKETEEEEITDDTPIEDLTAGDLKSIIADLVAQMSTEPAPEGELGADMETADVEGAGEEDAPLEGDSEEDVNIDTEDIVDDSEEEAEEEDEEIDLSELLKELEQEERDRKVTTHSQDKEDACCNEAKLKKELEKKDKELKEAKEALENIKSTLSEVNLLNAKLSYTTRTLSKPLNESQKVRVMRAFDAATSPKEVKLIYKTLNESLDAELTKTAKPRVLKEHKGSASKFVGGNTGRGNIIETDPVVKRFQQLAGIIE